MLGTIFGVLIILSVIGALFTGNMDALGAAALGGAAESVTLLAAMLGTMCFWLALMRVMQDGGVTARMSKIFTPVFRLLFPSAADADTAAALTAAFIANLFGLGSAAMPAGIAAVKALQRHAADARDITDETVLFCLLNTFPLQLFPSSVMALRLSDGDADPYALLPRIWGVQLCCFFSAVLLCRILSRVCRRKSA